MSGRKRRRPKSGLQGKPQAAQHQAGNAHPLANKAGMDQAARIVPTDAIVADPEQPRKHIDEEALAELAESIKLHGMLNPLTVLERPNNVYQLVVGERRWRAAKKAEVASVPARIITGETQVRVIQLIENLQRQDLSLMEEAGAFQELQEKHSMSLRDLEAKLGKSKSYIQRRLEVLKFPDDVKGMLRKEPRLLTRASEIAEIADPARRARQIQSLLGETPPPRSSTSRGRPAEPFRFKSIKRGGFDLVVKYRPGKSNREELIERLRTIIQQLEEK